MRDVLATAGIVALTIVTVLATLYACPMTTQLLFGQPRAVFARPADLCVPISPG